MIDLLIGGIIAWFAGDTAAMLAGTASSVAAAKAAEAQAEAFASQNKAGAEYMAVHAALSAPDAHGTADPSRHD